MIIHAIHAFHLSHPEDRSAQHVKLIWPLVRPRSISQTSNVLLPAQMDTIAIQQTMFVYLAILHARSVRDLPQLVLNAIQHLLFLSCIMEHVKVVVQLITVQSTMFAPLLVLLQHLILSRLPHNQQQ